MREKLCFVSDEVTMGPRGTYLDGFGYEAGDVASGAELDDLLHVPRVLLGVGAEGSSVGVRVHGVVHAALNNVELPVLLRGGAHGAGGVAVVGIPERYDVVGAGVQTRHHDRELVRLCAGVGEEDNLCDQ
jgi:hypothetical protein